MTEPVENFADPNENDPNASGLNDSDLNESDQNENDPVDDGLNGSVDARVVLRSAGVMVLLDASAGQLPAILHWGADLGDVDAATFGRLAAAQGTAWEQNTVDATIRVALLPESRTGWSGRPGLSGSRSGRDWSPRFVTREIRVDEMPLRPGPRVSEGTRLEVDAGDPDAGLDLTLSVELGAGGLLRSRAVITNTGAQDYQLNELVLAYPVPSVAREVLDLAGRWGKERTPQRRELVVGTHLRENRKGRTGADAATVLHLGVPGFGFADGEIWAVHTGWSGNHLHYAERTFTGVQLIGGGELLLPGEVVLGPGQSYRSPWIYGSHGVGLDAVARRFHHWLRARPQHPDRARPVTLNVWEAVYFDHDLARLLDLAERAAALGVERYVLDDGWFGARRNDRAGLGDWQVSADVWPDGLSPLTDRVVELGMQFGLWVEPEMVNPDSDVARAHPEWVMATGHRWPVEARHQQVINLGIPECYAYVRDAISALLTEYPIGYLKWDHNRDLVDAGTQPEGRPGVHEQTLATYRLMAELKSAHPGLEIESCSSGGSRVDLGVLEFTDRVWTSDNIDPLDRQQMNRWTTQLIPPELMGSHVASGRSHTTGRQHDLSFRAATAVFGHFGIEWDLTRAVPDETEELAAWITFYQEHRDLLLGGDLVRVDHPDQALWTAGVVAPDRSRAIFSFASLSRSEVTSVGQVPLPGLEPSRHYRVRPVRVGPPAAGLRPPDWWDRDDVELSGAALAHIGLRPPSLFPEHAVLIMLDAVD